VMTTGGGVSICEGKRVRYEGKEVGGGGDREQKYPEIEEESKTAREQARKRVCEVGIERARESSEKEGERECSRDGQ